MPRTIRDVFNQGDLNKLGSAALVLALGDELNNSVQTLVSAAVAGLVTLPDAFRAQAVLQAFDRTNGVYLAVAANEVVAGAGQVSVLATGNISVDPACLSVELMFVPSEGIVVTETLQVVAGVATFLAGKNGRKLLTSNVDVGVIPGAKIVAIRGPAPAAGRSAISADGATVRFNAADVVNGQATVKYIAGPSTTGVSRLNSVSQF